MFEYCFERALCRIDLWPERLCNFTIFVLSQPIIIHERAAYTTREKNEDLCPLEIVN
jgi:hypothetical protein